MQLQMHARLESIWSILAKSITVGLIIPAKRYVSNNEEHHCGENTPTVHSCLTNLLTKIRVNSEGHDDYYQRSMQLFIRAISRQSIRIDT